MEQLGADVDTQHVSSINEQAGAECGNISSAAASLALEHGPDALFQRAAVGEHVNIRKDNAHFCAKFEFTLTRESQLSPAAFTSRVIHM